MGTIGASVLFIIAAFFVISMLGLVTGIWVAVLAGAVGGIIIGLVTGITLPANRWSTSPNLAKPVQQR